MQKAFAGTACEKCAEDNVFGPNCTSGISGVGFLLKSEYNKITLKWHECFHTEACMMSCVAV